MRYEKLFKAMDEYKEAVDRHLPNYDPVGHAEKSKKEAIKIAEDKLDDAFIDIIEFVMMEKFEFHAQGE